jgi:hypothetical protein
MTTAPQDGTVIEGLVDGVWHPMYWSDSADDMSPYGTAGWAHEPDRLLILDVEGWRELPEHDQRLVDEPGIRLAEAEAAAQARIQDEVVRRQKIARERRAASQRNRASLEARYATLFDAEPPKLRMKDLRRQVARAEAIRGLAAFASITSEIAHLR